MNRHDLNELIAKGMYERKRRGFPRTDTIRPYVPWQELGKTQRNYWRRLVTAALSVLDQAGMAIVPKVPTPEMVEAGIGTCMRSGGADEVLAAEYRAMIEAALTDQQI